MMWLKQAKRNVLVLALGLFLLVPRVEAQERAALDSLRQVAARIGARLDSLEAGLCPSGLPAELRSRVPTGDAAVDSLAATLDRLELRVWGLARARCAAVPAKPVARADSAADELAALWQLSRSTYSQMSVSGQYGTNPDTSLTTALGVAAARFAWRPPQHALTRGFTLRGEFWALKRKFELAPSNRFDRTGLGGYVDGTWKLNRQWGADVYATSCPEQIPAEEIRTS